MRRLVATVLFLIALGVPTLCAAHEVRPCYLEITEAADHSVHILWKMPATGDYGLPLHPAISSGWMAKIPDQTLLDGVELVQRWTVAAPHAPIKGQKINIAGLEKTITDVLLRVQFSDGTEIVRLIHPSDPAFTIPADASSSLSISSYLLLGVHHIWTGVDHLLYVLGLMLLVRNLKTLLGTLTAFTVAHSITLALATLNIVNVPPAPVEAAIALSIVYVAVELVQPDDKRGLAGRRPWLIAFAFGLLHGLGFASALRQVGLPSHDIPEALFLFNVGIEAGQIAFVMAALAVLGTLRAIIPILEIRVQQAVPYVVGSLASFWLIERSLIAFQLIAS
jgi:hydrogenase/urease accessory protein HupE